MDWVPLPQVQQQFEQPWDLGLLPPEFTDGMMSGIVAFEIPIARLEGKLKLSQNRSPADQQAVLDALAQRGDDGSAGVARMMERSLCRRGQE